MTQPTRIEDILLQYAPLLARIAATYEADLGLREDLIQDISLAVWRALETFRGDSSVKTFIAKVAHNRSVDHVLRESRRNKNLSNESVDDLQNLTSNTTNQEKHLDLMSAIRQLALGYRQIITMQLEGFTQLEIASVLGLSEAAVAKRAGRARQQLEQLL
ncbi:RNA polymerase sigma factor [Aliiglaciecola lipolytica]|uniref:RNA polymerase sigma factor, sigma-70 family protein n=1 Tax=Aliiglaciecola lipolytica E3 TaxID=1127673 RepID=K6YIR9_9ALTE|nr:sigma-70 family RNA polymerase sigma factor [Aliiglaciecola lipolytica]GAC16508.1 RNA polymerase sigma factor, sigma-70 family protein [Aliiglaciecola lipolytica E3]